MIPQILDAIKTICQILQMAKGLVAFVEANKNERWFQDVADTMAQIKSAQTEQEYKDVAKKLRDLWSSSG